MTTQTSGKMMKRLKKWWATWKAKRTNATIRKLKAENVKLTTKLKQTQAMYERVYKRLQQEDSLNYQHSRHWMNARNAISEILNEDVFSFELRTKGKKK